MDMLWCQGAQDIELSDHKLKSALKCTVGQCYFSFDIHFSFSFYKFFINHFYFYIILVSD